jgi:hypothetical protein
VVIDIQGTADVKNRHAERHRTATREWREAPCDDEGDEHGHQGHHGHGHGHHDNGQHGNDSDNDND